MKKLLLFAAAAMAVAGAGHMTAAHAAPTCVPGAGCLGVNDAGYLVVGDGDAANPDPLDGYAGITSGGSIDCGSDGGPYSDTPVTPGCNPSAP